MSTINRPAGAPESTPSVHYPERDGMPMAETGLHVALMITLLATLRAFFRHRRDFYITGNIFLYYEEGQPKSRRSPDIMLIKGVDASYERPSFKTWEERAVPSIIIELTSKETAAEDVGPKRELYERLGVREYFLFDPLRHYLERPLMGYRLVLDEYEPLPPDPDGGILSAELGLRLLPEGEQLALVHFRTGQRVLPPTEAMQLLEDTLAQVQQTEQRAEQERQRAEQERQRAEREHQRAEQLEAELSRLRAQLSRPAGESGPQPS